MLLKNVGIFLPFSSQIEFKLDNYLKNDNNDRKKGKKMKKKKKKKRRIFGIFQDFYLKKFKIQFSDIFYNYS